MKLLLFFLANTANVTDLTQCWIRFVFDGDYYYAMIDDLNISLADAYDLEIGAADAVSNNFSNRGDQIHLTNNRYIPISQISTNHIQYFGANVVNLGHENVLPADNAQLKMKIQQNIANVWTTVFNDSTALDSTFGAEIRTVFDTISDYSWVETGDFRVVYNSEFDADVN